MTPEQLQGLSDDELQALIDTAGKLIKDRREDRKKQAIEEARAKLAAVGLSFRDLAGSPAKKRAENKRPGPKLKPGDRYVNPADASQQWTVGRGRPPKWVTDLEAKGQLPAPQPEKPAIRQTEGKRPAR